MNPTNLKISFNLAIKIKLLSFLFFTFIHCNHEEQIKKTSPEKEEPQISMVKEENKQSNKVTNKETFTLEELYYSALSNTERIAIKKEAIVQAEARKDSFFASFFPTLSFRYQQLITTPDHSDHDRKIRNRNNIIHAYSNENYGTNIATPYDIRNSSLFGGSGTANTTSPLVRPGARLVLHIPIMTGLNEWTSYKNAKHEVKLRHLELKFDEGRMFLEIAQAYFNLLQLESNFENKKRILELTKESKLELQKRVSLGRNKNSELSSVTAQIARLEAEILAISDTLSQLKDTLSFLTGVNSSFSIQPTNELPTNLDLPEAEKKIESRYDINAAKLNLEIAKSEVTKAYGGHLPTAAIDTFYTFPTANSGTNTKDLVNQFVVQIPLLSMGTVTAAIKQAKSLERQAELQLTQSIRFAKDEIRKAYNSYTNSKLAEESYFTALSASENNYKIVYRDYLRKSATILDLLNSQINLENAKEELLKARLQKQLNLVWLKVAIGEYPDRLERKKD